MQSDVERTLSPHERKLRESEASYARSRKDREHLDEYHSEMTAVGRTEGDDTPDSADNNQIFKLMRKTRNQRRWKAKNPYLSEIFGIGAWSLLNAQEMFGFLGKFAAAAISHPHVEAVSAAARKAGKNIDPLHAFEDKNFVYETVMVSERTAEELARQTAIIESKVDAMESATCVHKKRALAEEVVDLAEEFQMREHPVTKDFVHELEAVEALEEHFNPNSMEETCTAEVCVVRFKNTAMDSRSIKRTISDVYNTDAAEVELTQAEKVVQQARPVLPPHIRSWEPA